MTQATDVKLPPDKTYKLKQAIAALHKLLPDVDKLESCGDNCGELRQTILDQIAKGEQILKHFGTTQ